MRETASTFNQRHPLGGEPRRPTDNYSRSYPYLSLSRAIGVDYGVILLISDAIDAGGVITGNEVWRLVEQRRDLEMLRREVFSELDHAKANGYYGPEALRTMTSHQIAVDLADQSASCGEYESSDLRVHVEGWIARELRQ